MGMARLLAKGWVVFCLFAAAHALRFALMSGTAPLDAAETIGISALLFIAMGLLFVGGYAAASDRSNVSWLRRIKPRDFVPTFYDVTFIAFVVLSFVNQVAFAPYYTKSGAAEALRVAIHFAVPGQRALETALSCSPDEGRVLASAFTWLLAIIYLGSAVSRGRLTAGLIRIERAKRSEAFGTVAVAVILCDIAVITFQLLYIGSVFAFLPCSAYSGVSGALLIGLSPLMLAYLIVAAVANLLAVSAE